MAEQALLLDEILEDMDNLELNARIKALADEKQDILDRMQALEKDESRRSLQAEGNGGVAGPAGNAVRRVQGRHYTQVCGTNHGDRSDTIQDKIKDIDVMISGGLC